MKTDVVKYDLTNCKPWETCERKLHSPDSDDEAAVIVKYQKLVGVLI